VKDPGTEDVGAESPNATSPYVFVTSANADSDGVAWPTDTTYVVEAVLNFPVSVGVNVAVIVAEPAPATVTAPVEEFTVATEVFDEA